MAVKFRISRGLVGRLLKAHKADPSFVDLLQQKEQAFQQRVDVVVDAATKMCDEHGSIRRISQVQRQIAAEQGMELKPHFVSSVMRKGMRLRYKRVKKVPFQANLEDRLVLRHLYAREMLQLMSRGPRIFNIDESWINDLSWN